MITIKTSRDVGAECRHDMRPSVQLPGVLGVDSDQPPGASGADYTLYLTTAASFVSGF